MKTCLKFGALVPGLPHILLSDVNPTYKELAGACKKIGDEFQSHGIKRVIYYSTQWISVLGHSFQTKPDVTGVHVDENWHDFKNLNYAFKVDVSFSKALAQAAEKAKYQVKLINYDHFPIDTGTIVADTLINRGRFKTAMISCCVYSDYNDTINLFHSMRSVFEADAEPTAIVTVSHLSGRFFTMPIDLREDRVSSDSDDQWNKEILAKMEAGSVKQLRDSLPTYNASCKTDMGMKALAALEGSQILKEGLKARISAYGGIYGTGAAVVTWKLV